MIGLGSMIGAGIFAAFAPAAAATGNLLLPALGIAALVAYCNATSTARLAAVHPTSGGTYAYGTRQLGKLWGYLAGWSFITGKTASCAAMALTVAHYILPPPLTGWAPLIAIAVVVALTLVNLAGIQKSALLTRIIVTFVLLTLLILLLSSWLLNNHNDEIGLAELNVGGNQNAHSGQGTSAAHVAYGLLQAAGLLFFAFAGYARIATLGEEVRQPERTIPRAIPIALGITLVVYAAVASAALHTLGAAGLSSSTQPLVDLARHTNVPVLVWMVSLAAVLAATGSLVTMILGVSRTGLAMARDGHLPCQLAVVDQRHHVPRRMELTVMVAVIIVVGLADVVTVIGISSFGVLVYYCLANISAMTLTQQQNRPMLLIPVVGLVGCILLAASVPLVSLIAGAGMTLLGLAVYGLRAGIRRFRAGYTR